jgi:hypothetical protein
MRLVFVWLVFFLVVGAVGGQVSWRAGFPHRISGWRERYRRHHPCRFGFESNFASLSLPSSTGTVLLAKGIQLRYFSSLFVGGDISCRPQCRYANTSLVRKHNDNIPFLLNQQYSNSWIFYLCSHTVTIKSNDCCH